MTRTPDYMPRRIGKTAETAMNVYEAIGNAKVGDKMVIFKNGKIIKLTVDDVKTYEEASPAAMDEGEG